MALTDNMQFTNSFQGGSSYVPLCGVILNKYDNFQNFSQARYSIAAGADQAVAADPVVIRNQVTSTANANAIEGFNAICGEITAKATTIANLSGFQCQSPTDIVPINGGEAYPVAGFLSYAALLGSGAELYLPCDSSLVGVDYNTRVTYDFSAKVIKKSVVGAGVPIPARIKSGVVNAKQLIYNDSTKLATWEDCTAVLVELVNMMESIETT